MKKTILVKEIVETFDDYLKDVSKGLIKEDINAFFYTDGFNGKDLTKVGTYGYRKMKVSESELLDLKEKRLKDLYNIIDSKYSQHSYNLFIGELLFRKMYECYEDYKTGNIGLNDRIEVVEDIFGCDKHSNEYFFNTMDELFGKCMTAMFDVNYGDRCFTYFPNEIDENYFSCDEDTEDYNEDNEEAKETQDYDEMVRAAAEYLESNYYNLDEFHYVVNGHGYGSWSETYYAVRIIIDKFLDQNSPNYIYEGLNGLDVYDFGIGLDEDNDHRWWDEADSLLYDFWTVRHKCMEMLYLITKIEKKETEGIDENIIEWYDRELAIGEGFRAKYNELSLNDFKMSDDGKLKIINNQEIYSLFGVDEKYIEKPKVEHIEEYDYEYGR